MDRKIDELKEMETIRRLIAEKQVEKDHFNALTEKLLVDWGNDFKERSEELKHIRQERYRTAWLKIVLIFISGVLTGVLISLLTLRQNKQTNSKHNWLLCSEKNKNTPCKHY